MIELFYDLRKKVIADAAKMHKSWTIWLNVLSGALGSAWIYLMANPDTLTQVIRFLPQLSSLLNPKILTIITVSLNVLNFILRFKTTKALSEK